MSRATRRDDTCHSVQSVLTSALVASSRIKTFGFATRTRATGTCIKRKIKK